MTRCGGSGAVGGGDGGGGGGVGGSGGGGGDGGGRVSGSDEGLFYLWRRRAALQALARIKILF